MNTRLAWTGAFGFAALAAAAAATACVGDAATTPDGVTSEGGTAGGSAQACYPNGSCNAGLTCVQASNVCVDLDDSGNPMNALDGGDSAAPGSCPAAPSLNAPIAACIMAGVDAGRDAAVEGGAPTTEKPITCVTLGGYECVTATKCDSDGLQVGCNTSADCNGGHCCTVPNGFVDAGTCAVASILYGTATACQATACSTNDTRNAVGQNEVCTSDHDCSSGYSCLTLAAECGSSCGNTDFKFKFGICR